MSVTIFKLGVGGIAASSLIAALVVDICYYVKINRCFRDMGCADVKYSFSTLSIKRSIGYSIPSTLQQTIMYIASLMISPLVNALGSGATAAYSVVNRIYEINANIYQNSSKVVSNYTAHCMGAKEYKKIRKGLYVGLLQGICLLTPVLAVCIFCAEPICRAFFPKGYADAGLAYSVVFATSYLPFIAFNLINNLFHSFYRGLKCTNMLVISTLIGSLSRIITSYLMKDSLGIHGIYAGWTASWIIESVFCVVSYKMGTWKKSIPQKL